MRGCDAALHGNAGRVTLNHAARTCDWSRKKQKPELVWAPDKGTDAAGLIRLSTAPPDDQQWMTFVLLIPLVAFRESTTSCDSITIFR